MQLKLYKRCTAILFGLIIIIGGVIIIAGIVLILYFKKRRMEGRKDEANDDEADTNADEENE